MHPLNRFRDGYDFPSLVAAHPPLAPFVIRSPRDEETIDFADPAAVLTLNQALLKDAYGLQWSLPPGALCPPIPGRLDYIHHLAALLGGGDAEDAPRGRDITILDLCAGANCILPLLGAAEYGWRYVATEADQSSHRWARQIVRVNPAVAGLIEGRHQPDVRACFANVTTPSERFAACSCNPPFHASHEDAAAGSARKRRNLKLGRTAAPLNFGGSSNELVCEGGEVGFITRMIAESATCPELCVWFTVMVSKSVNLPVLKRALARTPATIVRTIDMAQGQKKSRLLAWTFVRV